MTSKQITIRVALVALGCVAAALAMRTPGASTSVMTGEPALFMAGQVPTLVSLVRHAAIPVYRLPTIEIVARRLTAEEIAQMRSQDRVTVARAD